MKHDNFEKNEEREIIIQMEMQEEKLLKIKY